MSVEGKVVGIRWQRIGNFETPAPYEVWKTGVALRKGKGGRKTKLTRLAEAALAPVPDEPPLEPGEQEDEDSDGIAAEDRPRLDREPTTRHREQLQFIARAPLWISAIGYAVDRNNLELIELSTLDATDGVTPIRAWVTRQQITSKRELGKLASLRFPVNDNNAAALVEYLDCAYHHNAQRDLPLLAVAQRTGFYKTPNGDAWLLGNDWIAEEPARFAFDVPRGPDTRYARHFRCNGSADAWIAKLREVDALGPQARWMTYNVFAAPLIRPLDHRSFFVHQCGDSRWGKTTMARFAMSAMGDSSEGCLMGSWNGSDVAMLESMGSISDVPCFFDEIEMKETKAGGDASGLIYIMTGGNPRNRAGKQGGTLESIMSWRSVLRTTGEGRLLGRFGFDKGGQATRTIEVTHPCLPTPAYANTLRLWLSEQHYGHAGRIFLEKLRAVLGDGRVLSIVPDGAAPELFAAEVFAAHRRALDVLAEEGAGPRFGGHVAIVAVAQALARIFLLGSPRSLDEELAMALEDGITTVVRDANAAENARTVVDAGLQALRDLRERNREFWFDTSQPEAVGKLNAGTAKRVVGITRGAETWIVMTEAERALKEAGVTGTDALWRKLRALDVMVQASNGGYRLSRKFGAWANKVYVLRTEKFEPVED